MRIIKRIAFALLGIVIIGLPVDEIATHWGAPQFRHNINLFCYFAQHSE
jgi:hypothetical protein